MGGVTLVLVDESAELGVGRVGLVLVDVSLDHVSTLPPLFSTHVKNLNCARLLMVAA